MDIVGFQCQNEVRCMTAKKPSSNGLYVVAKLACYRGERPKLRMYNDSNPSSMR